VNFHIYGIDTIRFMNYNFTMSISTLKANNLVKLLDGLSLLDDEDRERIIRVVDALEFTEKKVKEEIFYDVPAFETGIG